MLKHNVQKAKKVVQKVKLSKQKNLVTRVKVLVAKVTNTLLALSIKNQVAIRAAKIPAHLII